MYDDLTHHVRRARWDNLRPLRRTWDHRLPISYLTCPQMGMEFESGNVWKAAGDDSLKAPLGTSHYSLSILADDFAHVRFSLIVLLLLLLLLFYLPLLFWSPSFI